MRANPTRDPTSSSSARDGLYNAARLVTSAVSGIATSALAARVLGTTATGTYAYVLWSATVVALIAGLGMQTAATKFIAELLATGRNSAAAWLTRRILRVQLWATFLATPAVASLCLFNGAGQLRLYLAAAGLMIAISFQQLETALLAGARQYRTAARIGVFTSFLQLLLSIAVAVIHGGVFAFVAAQVLGTALRSALLYRAVARTFQAFDDEADTALSVLVERFRKFVAVDIYLTILDQVVWQRTEIFFLAWYTDARSVAIYAVAIALSARLTEAAWALFHFLWPVASETYARDGISALEKLFRDSVRMVLLVIAPISVAIAVSAPAAIHLLYGNAFEPAVPVVRVLFLILPLYIVVVALNPVLYALNLQAVSVPMDTATAALNIALDIVLIRRYGVMGAVVAGCVPQLLQAAMMLVYLTRRLGCQPPWKSLVRISGAVLVPGSLAISYTYSHATTLASLTAAILVLAGSATALAVTGEWTATDTRALRSAFPGSVTPAEGTGPAMTSNAF